MGGKIDVKRRSNYVFYSDLVLKRLIKVAFVHVLSLKSPIEGVFVLKKATEVAFVYILLLKPR